MSKYVSRGESIDTEKCVAQAGGNRFDMIIMASNRAREIKRNNSHSDRIEHLHSPVTALLELQNDGADPQWPKKVK